MAANASDRPNLIVIQTDEHNFRTLGCYRKLMAPEQALMWGKNVVETPHIDSLCERGVICTSFYATTPVCSPSRGSLVTGMYPQSTNVVTNNIPLGDHVTTEAGTGAVHTAPAHGQDDFVVGEQYGLEVYNPVGGNGVYLPETEHFGGQFVFKANDSVNITHSLNTFAHS